MANVVAAQLAGDATAVFSPQATATKLKVTGVNLFSAGDFADAKDREEIVLRDAAQNIYKRLVIKDNRLICKDVGVVCVESGYDIHFAGAAGLDIKGTELLCHVTSEDETIEIIAALVQLYREQGRYLERIYKWAKRVGIASIQTQVVSDLDRRRALYERFVYAQQFAQTDPWAERVQGKDAHEFAPIADFSRQEAAE